MNFLPCPSFFQQTPNSVMESHGYEQNNPCPWEPRARDKGLKTARGRNSPMGDSEVALGLPGRVGGQCCGPELSQDQPRRRPQKQCSGQQAGPRSRRCRLRQHRVWHRGVPTADDGKGLVHEFVQVTKDLGGGGRTLSPQSPGPPAPTSMAKPGSWNDAPLHCSPAGSQGPGRQCCQPTSASGPQVPSLL